MITSGLTWRSRPIRHPCRSVPASQLPAHQRKNPVLFATPGFGDPHRFRPSVTSASSTRAAYSPAHRQNTHQYAVRYGDSTLRTSSFRFLLLCVPLGTASSALSCCLKDKTIHSAKGSRRLEPPYNRRRMKPVIYSLGRQENLKKVAGVVVWRSSSTR